jgi:hypothetical protein
VKIWGGQPAAVLTSQGNQPVVVSHDIDSAGNESWHCRASYKASVPRESTYAVAWDNGSPIANVGCTNSKSQSDAQVWQDTGADAYTRPVISFTLLCTDNAWGLS